MFKKSHCSNAFESEHSKNFSIRNNSNIRNFCESISIVFACSSNAAQTKLLKSNTHSSSSREVRNKLRTFAEHVSAPGHIKVETSDILDFFDVECLPVSIYRLGKPKPKNLTSLDFSKSFYLLLAYNWTFSKGAHAFALSLIREFPCARPLPERNGSADVSNTFAKVALMQNFLNILCFYATA